MVNFQKEDKFLILSKFIELNQKDKSILENIVKFRNENTENVIKNESRNNKIEEIEQI